MAESSMHNTGAESFGIGTTQSLEARRLLERAAQALRDAAPRLLRMPTRGLRFTRLYDIAEDLLGQCSKCGAWPGEQHDAESDACTDGLYSGLVTPREFDAVREVAETIDEIANARGKNGGVLEFDEATLERAIQRLTHAAARAIDGEEVAHV